MSPSALVCLTEYGVNKFSLHPGGDRVLVVQLILISKELELILLIHNSQNIRAPVLNNS